MKRYSTIGCCGIDCGLCPRFHIKGESVCPGCDGLNFSEKHPSCGYLTCCVTRNRLEVCSECNEYPCKRFESERKGTDSFVTHKKVFLNLDFIKNNSLERFIEHQNIRIRILKDFLETYDDGRSKSLFCMACALLPLERLQEVQHFMKNSTTSYTCKDRNTILKNKIQMIASDTGTILKLRNK
jgi:hypothetical protein